MASELQEEKQNLNVLLLDLDLEINKMQSKVNRLEKELVGPIFGYDERDRWILNRDRFNRNSETLKEYRMIRKCPYFGRIDLECEGKTEEKYIGERGLMLNFHQRILDWRTEVGNIFYSSSKNEDTDFVVGNTYYNLMLRREITIKNSKLISCKTTFNQIDDIFEDGVVDSFLIEVLKDKRRNKAVTNIIKTIQYNQNEIMRKPLKENFVVQGCAGSGKTMILLHRLSYLLFNDLIKPEQIKVVTPNKYFDSQIDNLSKELGLELIRRYTIEEYYKYLLEQFPNGKVSSDISNEIYLSHEMLQRIYSEEFMNSVKTTYKNIEKEYISLLEKNKVNEILESVHYPRVSLGFGNLNSLNSVLKTPINNIIKVTDGLQELDNLNLRLEEIDSYMKDKMPLLIGVANSKKKEYRKTIDTLNKEIMDLEISIRNLKNKRTRKETEKELDIDYSSVLTIDYLLNEENDLTSFILNRCNEDYNQYLSLLNEFESIPQYNFMRRNNVKKQMNIIEESFLHAASIALQEYENQYIKEKIEAICKEIDEKIKTHENKKTGKQKEIDDIKYILNRNEYLIDQLTRNVQTGLFMEFCSLNDLKETSYYRDMLENVKEIRKINSRKKELLNYKEQMDLSAFDRDYFKNVLEIQKLISKMSFNEVYKVVFNDTLKKVYAEYSFKENKKLYRHSLFFRLFLNSLYFEQIHIKDELICIDEAQDYSVSEYALFKSINHNASFNLYGDINQIVFEYETLMDWSFLDSLNIKDVYVLNQNYRNTEQITEYCNSTFGSEMIPIGITGNVVCEKKLNDVLKFLKEIYDKHENYRVVIIYKELTKDQHEILLDFSKQIGIEMDVVNEKGISILPIYLVKGMEFDAVAVLANSMEFNEQYVAYTRALDNLFIVR